MELQRRNSKNGSNTWDKDLSLSLSLPCSRGCLLAQLYPDATPNKPRFCWFWRGPRRCRLRDSRKIESINSNWIIDSKFRRQWCGDKEERVIKLPQVFFVSSLHLASIRRSKISGRKRLKRFPILHLLVGNLFFSVEATKHRRRCPVTHMSLSNRHSNNHFHRLE